MAHFAALWIFFLAFADAVILLWCQSHDLENNTSIMAQRNEDTYLPLLDEAYTMLERVSPRNAGGAGSWIEVVAISRAFAKALAAAPLSMQSMNALLTFLLVVPDFSRFAVTEEAAAVLLGEGLIDSASCLFGNVASAGPTDSQMVELFFRRSLELQPHSPATVRSFGFYLQIQGKTQEALQLYDAQLRHYPNQAAVYLSRASLCPHHFESVQASHEWYYHLWNRLTEVLVTLKELDSPRVKDIHVSLQQQPSIGWQYLGLPISPLVTLANKAMLLMDPDLVRIAPGLSVQHCWSGGLDTERSRNKKSKADHSGDSGGDTVKSGRRLRLGIVMERRASVSPVRVFSTVLHKLDKRKFEVLVFAQNTPQSPPGAAILAAADRVVFFPGHENLASVSEPTRAGGGRIVSLGLPSLHHSREVIQAEKLDCILYLELGASLFQHLLSIGRLAPLQLSFGLGHPVTSGHEGIDFFLSSDLFETALETEKRGELSGVDGDSKVHRNGHTQRVDAGESNEINTSSSPQPGDSFGLNHNGTTTAPQPDADSQKVNPSPSPPLLPLDNATAAATGSPSMTYTEQVVLFDSFTGYFHPPRNPDPERVKSMRERIISLATGTGAADFDTSASPAATVASGTEGLPEAAERANGDIQRRRGWLGESPRPSVSGHTEEERTDAEEERLAGEDNNGVFNDGKNNSGGGVSSVRLYHCLQDSKKFHPSFDEAMRGILERDPGARLLIPEEAKIHARRWNRTLGPAAADRLLFLSEMEHPFMMEVIAACDVMLAPWGWGAGITSLEALAFGLPVVTLPSMESVLHFSMGQIALLGLEDELIAKDPDDYVSKAVRLATDLPYRHAVSTRIIEGHGPLFGHSVATMVAEEWGAFIQRGVRMVCPQET